MARQLNKTDANDAFGLAQLVRSGWYRAVGPPASSTARALLRIDVLLMFW